MSASLSRTPFGNPDGSRSDIQDVVDNFVTFDRLPTSMGLGLHPDDLSPRVIVGAKGSGKTVYLRRLRAAAVQNESVYSDIVQQDLPTTSNIVKFCQCFTLRDLTEKWMQLWYCAIIRSLVTHMLHAKQLSEHLTVDRRSELESYPTDFVPRSRRELSVYSQVTEIIHSHHTAHAYSRYFDHPAWAELSATVSDIITDLPPIYFFIDSVDEEYASAPMYWLQCQKGLFFRAMRFLRDQHFGGRLHVIVCVRDHVMAAVLRGEHQNRYRGEPHIMTLGWEYSTAEFFFKEKIGRLPVDHLIQRPQGKSGTIEDWLGCSFIENRGRRIREPVLQYLLRHTRLLPRDIVILGNRLSEIVIAARQEGRTEVPQAAIRRSVREVARSFGNEQIAICANHLASSGMPTDAARMGYDEIYTGNVEYARTFADQLRDVLQVLGKDRFDKDDLALAGTYAAEAFGAHSDAFSVLWQNRLLGYTESTPDGPREVFFSEVNCDDFKLPLDKAEYVLHSSLIDTVGLRPVGPPVGQGAMQERVDGPPNQPGHIGHYVILGVIGRGGMGTVYLAEDTRLKRRVAVKMLPDATSSTARDLMRVRHEALVLAALNHPNIATVFSLEEEGTVHYITMEYVAGDTLGALLARGPLPVDRVLAVFRQIAVALHAAHGTRVIHRDLKPANIMVTPQGLVKVLDFGLAKVVEQHAAEAGATPPMSRAAISWGVVHGTVGYMSPEQLMGSPVDARSDIWAFGCCLFESLAGRPAFGGESLPARMLATMERDPDWGAVAGTPVNLRQLLQRCLEKDPMRRLASMAAVIEGLDGASSGP